MWKNAIVVRNEVLLCSAIDPVTLTFEPQKVPLLVYTKIIPYTKFEHFGIIHFWVMLRTNRQTDGLENATHADWQLAWVINVPLPLPFTAFFDQV